MKTIEEILEYIGDQLEREERNMQESRCLAGVNSPGFCMASGSYTTLYELKDFIEGKE